MAASELEIEPDLNKAPPHVEGELLKQNSKAIVGKKGWRKYFFIVLRDKLQYFRRREDYKQNKEPISFIRMSQVIEITEIVFSGVPKKHHLNCGFSIIAFHPTTQQQQSINLLAETPEDMRYWVHALRYIKAYWSKLQVRETVLSEEQERKLLERLFREEEDEKDILVGEYSLGEDGSVSTTEERNVTLSVYFADESKVKLNLLSSDTTSDLLDHERVKDKLTSSAAQLWFIDSRGNDQLLDPKDHPTFYQPKAHKFFALNPSHVVLVVFFARGQFECLPVSSNITVKEVMKHHSISVQLDISGVTNRGLFLKSNEEEQLFNSSECPCEVLFGVDENGTIVRQPVGHLLIKNKALGGARRTQKPRFKTTYRSHRTVSEEERLMERISEEEEAQSKALDLLIKKKLPGSAERDSTYEDGDWVVTNGPTDKATSKLTSSEEPKASVKQLPPVVEKDGIDTRGFEDSIEVEVARTGRTGRAASLPTVQVARPRSSAVLGTNSPIASRRRSPGADGVHPQRQKRLSPSSSPPTSSPERRSRSRSPRRLPDLPTVDESNGSLRRRNATRRGTISEERTVSNSKGPTIIVLSDMTQRAEPQLSPPATRTRSPSVRKAFVSDLHAVNSRSSAFGVTSLPQTNLKPEITPKAPSNYSDKRSHLGENEEDRLEKLLSRSYQQEAEEESIRNFKPVDTLTDKYHAALGQRREEEKGGRDSGRDEDVSHPMVIDFTQLVARQPSPLPPDATAAVPSSQLSAPIVVHSPSLLKVILLQSLEASTGTIEAKPMDFISLSGVCLRNDHGVWRMQEGCNFHDPLAFDSEDHTETFPLPGGIRAVYNHTHKRWHVLPAPSSTPSMDESRSEVDSIEHSHSLGEHGESEATLYMTKRAIVMEIGSAFHDVMQQFECTRDILEKRRIGSDMTNVAIGHIVRGKFCSALARLILDGLKPYRMEGLVVDDIWRVTVAFCNEAQTSHVSPLVFPAFDKQILQPIGFLKSLKDNNTKFRTFVCLAMSKGMLCDWLEALPKQKDTLRKYYLPTGFLPLASQVEAFSQLYQQVILTLEPIIHLPFDLSIDFESKHVEQQAKQAETQEGLSPSSQQQNNQTPQSVSPQPLRTVVKIHAATGQKTTAGNVLTAVWQSPVDVKGQPAGRDETDTKELRSSLQALKDIQERHQAAASHQPPAPHEPPTSHHLPTSHQPPASNQPPATGEKKSWFKKLATSLQQINAGGAITGPPRPTPQQKRQAPNKPYERRVEALYNNIAEDADELSFTKGAVMAVKEQINEEWLICVYGNQTGIVPMNYVKVVP